MVQNPADNNAYDETYYRSHCGIEDYVHSKEMIDISKNIALRIKELFHPQTVLDVGCACGHLVSALRGIGIDAYGVDTSEYALSSVPQNYRNCCAKMTLPEKSLPKKFPLKFDLVTNIEVLEHIPEEHAIASVKTLTELSDTIIFSSSPTDFDEPTHINVQPLSYWCRIFAQFGFYSNIRLATELPISPQTIVFSKTDKPISDLLFIDTLTMYEKKLSDLANERLNIIHNMRDAEKKKAADHAAEIASLSTRLQEQEKLSLERLDIIYNMRDAEKKKAGDHAAEIASLSARLQEQEKLSLERLDIICNIQDVEKINLLKRSQKVARLSALLQKANAAYECLSKKAENDLIVFEGKNTALKEELSATIQTLAAQLQEYKQLAEAKAQVEGKICSIQSETASLKQKLEKLSTEKAKIEQELNLIKRARSYRFACFLNKFRYHKIEEE